MLYEVQRQELINICHMLYSNKLVTACDGNISMKVSNEHILLTPSAKNKGLLKKEDLIVVDLENNVIEGVHKVSKEYPMHCAIYNNRQDIKAVIHTHPVYATAFALAGKSIPTNYLIETIMMLKSVELAEYATPGTNEMVEVILPYIKTTEVILLKNHGALTYGVDIIDAYNKMDVLESISQTIIMSKVIGEPCIISDENMNKLKSI